MSHIAPNFATRRSLSSKITRILVPIFACGFLAISTACVGMYFFLHDKLETARIVNFDASEPRTASFIDLVSEKGLYDLQSCCEHSFKIMPKGIPGSDGSVSKFTVTSGDTMVEGSFRTEIRLIANPLYSEAWYTGRFFIPPDWKPSSRDVIVMQWHGTRDIFLFNEPGQSPPLELLITDNEFELKKRWVREIYSPKHVANRPENETTVAKIPMIPGKWYEWKFHVRWAPDGSGLLEAWSNGELVVRSDGPIGFMDLVGPYLKAGLYIPVWKAEGIEQDIPSRSVYFDKITASDREL